MINPKVSVLHSFTLVYKCLMPRPTDPSVHSSSSLLSVVIVTLHVKGSRREITLWPVRMVEMLRMHSNKETRGKVDDRYEAAVDDQRVTSGQWVLFIIPVIIPPAASHHLMSSVCPV